MSPQTQTDNLERYTQSLVQTARDRYADITGEEFDLIVHRWNGGYRLRLKPDLEETGESWEADLGPYCDTEAEFQRFLEGLTFNDRQIEHKAELIDE